MTSQNTFPPAACPDPTTPSDRFVVLMEDIARQDGMSPIAGRILGHLMMSETAVAFADLAAALSISRGSVSENTNFLEELGLIERCRNDGDRRDHFRYRDDAGEALIARQRRRTAEIVAALDALRLADDLGALQRQRIAFMTAFIKMTLAASEELLARMQCSGCAGPDGAQAIIVPTGPAGTDKEETETQ